MDASPELSCTLTSHLVSLSGRDQENTREQEGGRSGKEEGVWKAKERARWKKRMYSGCEYIPLPAIMALLAGPNFHYFALNRFSVTALLWPLQLWGW